LQCYWIFRLHYQKPVYNLDGSSCTNGFISQKNDLSDSDDAYMSIKSYGSINSTHNKASKSDSLDNKQIPIEEEHQKLSKATLKDMLSYSLSDWPWILGGVTFLICASVSQVFLPLFIGKVVSGILYMYHICVFI